MGLILFGATLEPSLTIEQLENLDPVDQWRAMHSLPRPSAVGDFPGTIGGKKWKIRIFAATQEEIENARINARRELLNPDDPNEIKYTVAELEDPFIRDTYQDRISQHVLAAVCRSAEPVRGSEKDKGGPDYRVWFDGAKDVRRLSKEALSVLYAYWQIVQKQLGPFASDIQSEEDLNRWIRRLGEGGSAFPLGWRNSLQLLELAFGLGQRAYALSQILESHLESLPATLRSDLAIFNIGTSYYGARRVSITQNTLRFENDGIEPTEPMTVPDHDPNEPVCSPEVAQALASQIYGAPGDGDGDELS